MAYPMLPYSRQYMSRGRKGVHRPCKIAI